MKIKRRSDKKKSQNKNNKNIESNYLNGFQLKNHFQNEKKNHEEKEWFRFFHILCARFGANVRVLSMCVPFSLIQFNFHRF